MRPGPLLPRLLALVAAGALLPAVVPETVWLVAFALVALAGAAAIEASVLGRVRIQVERPAAAVLSLGEPEALALSVKTSADRPLRVVLRQVWPSLLDTPSVTREGLIRPGERLALELPVRGIARGRAALASPWLALRSWGLVERVAAPAEPAEVLVLPDLRAVRGLHDRLNRFVLRGLGTRVSARLGKGREFDRLREYVTGDELRDVAWKASARRGKLIVREYRLDRSQEVLMCLDRGHRMQARVGGLTKLDHAVNAAVMLAYIANRMEDKTSMLSFAVEAQMGVPSGRGPAHLRQLTDHAASVRGGALHTNYLVLAADLRRRLRHRALIVLFTALPELEPAALLRALRLLLPQHLPLVIVLRDPDLGAAAEMLPSDAAELSRTLAARDLVGAREQAVREARALGAMVVETDPGEAGVSAMNAYIDVKRRQLL
jgi:uncharacterized protein (DUF58 family)